MSRFPKYIAYRVAGALAVAAAFGLVRLMS